jgi:hypothetical protein
MLARNAMFTMRGARLRGYTIGWSCLALGSWALYAFAHQRDIWLLLAAIVTTIGACGFLIRYLTVR